MRIERSNLPILILAYNRDDLFNETLRRLLRQGFKNIYISIDGAKTNEDKLKQKEMLRCIESLHVNRKKVRIGEKNEGCRFGVISGITWFFKQEELGIINEDDIEMPCISAPKMTEQNITVELVEKSHAIEVA